MKLYREDQVIRLIECLLENPDMLIDAVSNEMTDHDAKSLLESTEAEPIEITEEEIVKIFRKHSFISDAGWVLISANDFEDTAEAILSKLKGES